MKLFGLQPYAGKRVCVALSGGRDSVALLHYFRESAGAYGISLSALTCEHGLRGEASLADLAFVERLCAQWEVPLRVFRADVARLARERREGVEEAGRNWRYACFREVLAAGEADLVATAHHRDDYAETVLFRLARGTALAGMDVFPAQPGIVRPLLQVPRAAIDAYIAENGLAFSEDASNADERFARNRLRRTVLPALEEAVPGAAEHLVAFAERAKADEAYLAALAKEAVVMEEGGAFRVPLGLPDPLFFRACLFAMKGCGILRDYTQAHLQEIAGLRALQSGRRAALPNGVWAAREQQTVVFYTKDDASDPQTSEEAPFAVGTFREGALTVGEGEHAHALAVDLDAFPAGCVVRTRREGDLFTPFGGARKTLKKFLTDRKISARTGKKLPVIAKGSEIYAVCGAEISERVRITAHTVRRGYLYTPLRAPDHDYGGNI